MASATFTGPGGTDPLHFHLSLMAAVQPTVGDGLWAGQYLRSAIRERSAAGVDVNGANFAPYSERYAKRKEKKLGHANTVDLFGYQHHPHMLNLITVRAGGVDLTQDTPVDATSYTQPSDLFAVGIYSEEAAVRAKAINEGGGKQPMREFFAPSKFDLSSMEQGIGLRMQARLDALPK